MSSETPQLDLVGLTEQEAQKRLKLDGYNELPSTHNRGFLAMALEVVREPMFLLLVLCGGIYLVLGEMSDAMMLLAFVFIIMGITIYQERKTERTLEALRDLSSPRALAIRDGAQKRIAGREVVRGDLLILAEGDRIPADAVLLDSSYMAVDESLLTGESVPVRKVPIRGEIGAGRPGGDDQPYVYSGTLIVKGKGAARVTATGLGTEMGKIGKALEAIQAEQTPLSRQTGRLVRSFALAALVLCAAIVALFGLTRGDWFDGILAGLTLAMAMIPEEFPVVLSVFLALGAWRIAQKNVLTRRVPAVESLGSAQVLCVDKTGTLTQNKMSIRKLVVGSEVFDAAEHVGGAVPETFHAILEFSILASHRDPFDPMERAFAEFGEQYLKDTDHLHGDWKLEREYPLSEELLAMSHVWRSTEDASRVIATKGAPEAIADLCHLSEAEVAALQADVDSLAREGLRVLAVAKARFDSPEMPRIQHDFTFEFLGLVGFADPVRPTVAASIKECYTAGIRVIMITGDYPSTAQNIAKQVGLAPHDEVITGPELDTMSDDELVRRIGNVNIFARVVPEQKLRLVKALRSLGSVVAMTGDGVNDAPALKAADIGIAMGGRGTDVAREAASLVLLDDDFSSIVHAVRLGRRIFDNLKKAIAYILAVHVPIAGLSLLPVLLGWPLILLPVHIVFLEMIIDPACSVIFEMESEEPNVMRRAPRERQEPLLNRKRLFLSLMQGLGILAIMLAVFWVSFKRQQLWLPADEAMNAARTLTFASLIVANVLLILVNRSWARSLLETLKVRNAAVPWVTGGALAFLALVVYVPWLRQVFHFAPMDALDVVVAVAAGSAGILWFEVVKRLRPSL